jgi:hypothetical protein
LRVLGRTQKVNSGKVIMRAAVLVGALLLGQAAFANPVRCSPGYQDSTCTPALANAPQPQPQCPNSAGWTTSVASQWIGSQWSAPSCNYQAPPSCVPGYDEPTPPVWDGSNWVGMVCIPRAPTITPAQQEAACQAALPSNTGSVVPYYGSGWTAAGTMTGAASYANVFSPNAAAVEVVAANFSCGGGYEANAGSGPPGSSDNTVYDIFVNQGLASQDPNTGQWGITGAAICYLSTGTTNVAYLTALITMRSAGTCH